MKQLLLLITLVISMSSQATLIELSFDQNQYNENDVITGQLVASDLSYTLGGFAGEIQFDTTSLLLTGWNFSDGFDDGLGSYPYADDSNPGFLYLEDYADPFADENTIIANQGTRFVLASFTFSALSAGIHTISLLPGMEVVSFDNSAIASFSQIDASISVNKVPEPTTMLLLASSLLLIRLKRS